jgi:hypothetical protein
MKGLGLGVGECDRTAAQMTAGPETGHLIRPPTEPAPGVTPSRSAECRWFDQVVNGAVPVGVQGHDLAACTALSQPPPLTVRPRAATPRTWLSHGTPSGPQVKDAAGRRERDQPACR